MIKLDLGEIKVIEMDLGEIKILEMLNHYWFVKGIINDKEMNIALNLIVKGHNPFRNDELITNWERKAGEIYSQLQLSNFYPPVDIRLLHD